MILRSRIRSLLEWGILLLLLSALLGSQILFGGVRLWMSGPFLLAVFFAGGLVLSLKISNSDGFRIPPAWLGLLILWGFRFYMIPRTAVPYEAKVEFIKGCSYLVAYWGFFQLVTTRGRWRFTVGLFLVAGSLLCWYAIIQAARGSNLVINTPRPEQYGLRASATFICPNHFAHLLEMMLILGAAVVPLNSAGWGLRMVGAYTAILTLPALLMTESRSGWIGASVGITVLILLLSARKSMARLGIALIALVLGFALLASALWSFSPTFHRRVTEAMKGNMRIQVWQDTVEMIKAKPLTGHGPGSYRWIYPRYKNVYSNGIHFPRYAHNEYLHLLAESGVVGFVLAGGTLLYFLAYFLARFRRTRSSREAVLIAALCGCVAASAAHACFDFNLHLFSNMHALVFLAGMTSGCLSDTDQRRVKRVPRFLVRCVSLLGIGICMALILVTARMLWGYVLVDQAEKLRETLENNRALERAEKACRISPSYWKAHKERGKILKTLSFWNVDREMKVLQAQDAAGAFARGIKLNPCDIHGMIEISQVYGDLFDDNERSLEFLHQAIEFAPRVFYPHAQLGLRLRRAGRIDEALLAFRRAQSLNRQDEMIRLNIKSLKKRIERREKIIQDDRSLKNLE